MQRISQLVAFGLLFIVTSGCSQSAHLREASKKNWSPELATFPELENVWSWSEPEKNNRPGMSHIMLLNEVAETQKEARNIAEQNKSVINIDFKPLGKMVKDPGFQSRLKALETATIPSKYATPERDEARRKYLGEWANVEKLLTSGAKPAAVESSLKNLSLYMEQMRYIPGQTPPTGDAAKKYAGVAAYEDPYKK